MLSPRRHAAQKSGVLCWQASCALLGRGRDAACDNNNDDGKRDFYSLMTEAANSSCVHLPCCQVSCLRSEKATMPSELPTHWSLKNCSVVTKHQLGSTLRQIRPGPREAFSDQAHLPPEIRSMICAVSAMQTNSVMESAKTPFGHLRVETSFPPPTHTVSPTHFQQRPRGDERKKNKDTNHTSGCVSCVDPEQVYSLLITK